MRMDHKLVRHGTLAVILVLFPKALPGQESSDFSMSAPEVRPLAKVARTMEVKFGLLINYEDPPYRHPDDVRDETDVKFKQQNPQSRALSVRAGQLNFRVPLAPGGKSLESPLNALQIAVTAYNALGLPGSFQVRSGKDNFSIVADAVKAENGQLAATISPLDSKLGTFEREVTGTQLVEALCEEMSRSGGVRVVPGLIPTNFLANTSVVLRLHGQTARDALSASLANLRWRQPEVKIPIRKLAWELFYSPGKEMYFLHLHVAMKEVPDRFFGRTVEVPQ